MRSLILLILFTVASFSAIAQQCCYGSQGNVCWGGPYTGQYNWGNLYASPTWKSVTVTANGKHHWQVWDTLYASGDSRNVFIEFYTCSTEDLQLNIANNGTSVVDRRNRNNHDCGSNPYDEHWTHVVPQNVRLYVWVLGDSCNNTSDTFTLYYRVRCRTNSNGGTYALNNWRGHVFDKVYGNLFTTLTSMGYYADEPRVFTKDFGNAQPPVNGNCSMCADSTRIDQDSFELAYRMHYYAGRGYYAAVCSTTSNVRVNYHGDFNNGYDMLRYPTNGSSYPVKANVHWLDSTDASFGNWIYYTGKDTGNLKADIKVVKMDGDLSFGSNVWKAYIYDSLTATVAGPNSTTIVPYMGTFTDTNKIFGYNFDSAPPAATGEYAGLTMNNVYYNVLMKMRGTFQKGRYKFRMRDAAGGSLGLYNQSGVITQHIFNTSLGANTDLTSAFISLNSDTNVQYKFYKYASNYPVSLNYCREPKNPGGIKVNGHALVAGNDTVCMGAPVTLTADTADGTETRWYIKSCQSSTGYIGSGASITVTPDSNTTYYVINRNLSVASGDTVNKLDIYSAACASKRLIRVTTPGAPTAPAAQSICSDTAYTFIFDSVLAGANGNQIEWSSRSNFDTSYIVNSGSDINITLNGGIGDTIYFRSRITATGCVSTSVNSTLTNKIKPTGHIMPSDTALTPWQYAVLSAQGGVSYNWFDIPFAGPDFEVIGLWNSAVYKVEITGANGCKDTAEATVITYPAIAERLSIRTGIDVNTYLAACIADTFRINVFNNDSTPQQFAIKIGTGYPSIADSFKLIPNAYFRDSVIGNDVYLITDSFPGSHLDSLKYILRAGCDALQVSGISIGLSLEYSLTDNDTLTNAPNQTFNIDSNGSNQAYTAVVNFRTPDIIQIPSSIHDSLALGENTTATIFYVNQDDSADYNGPLAFGPLFQCAGSSVIVDSLQLLLNDTIMQSIINPVFPDTLQVQIPRRDTLHMRLYLRLASCIPTGSCQASLKPGWGCGKDACQTVPTSTTITVTQSNPRTGIVLYRILPFNGKKNYPWDASCSNNETQWEFLIKNMGTLDADNGIIQLFKTDDSSFTLIDHTSVQVIGNDSRFPNTITPVHYDTIALMDSLQLGLDGPVTCFSQLKASGHTPLRSLQINIPVLHPDQSLVLRFRTLRCCGADNDFNGITYNRWKIKGTYIDCSIPRELNSSLPLNTFPDTIGSAILNVPYADLSSSSIGADVVPSFAVSDLQLVQRKVSGALNLTGGAPGCGIPSQISIENSDFPSSTGNLDYDAQLFCATDTPIGTNNLTGLHPRGQFKMVFVSEPGLELADSVPVIVGSTGTWRPASFVKYPTDSAMAVFDMDTGFSSTGINYTAATFRTFFGLSRLNFWVKGCCGGDTFINHPTGTVNTYFNPQLKDSSCSTCFIPLCRQKFDAELHCPGCITPGVNITYMVLQRTNYGFEDADDNQLPDSSTLRRINPTYAPLQNSSMSIDHSIPGDTLRSVAFGYLTDGDPVRGFTYADWQTYWDTINDTANIVPPPVMKHLYFEEWIPNANAVGLKCVGGFMQYFSIADTSIHPVFAFNINSSTPLQPDSIGRFIFHVPIDSLSGVVVKPGDNFRFFADYTLCTNPTSDKDLDVTGSMYYTLNHIAGFPYSSTPLVVDILHNNDSLDLTTTFLHARGYNPAIPGLFMCDGYFARQTVHPILSYYNEDWTEPSPCGKKAVVSAGYKIGKNLKNIFAYEYRPIPHIADSNAVNFHFAIPDGYRASVNYGTTELVYKNGGTSTQTLAYLNSSFFTPNSSWSGPGGFDFKLDRAKGVYAEPLQSMFDARIAYTPTLDKFKKDTTPCLLLSDEQFIQRLHFDLSMICSLQVVNTSRTDTIVDSLAYALLPNLTEPCEDSMVALVIDSHFNNYLSVSSPAITVTFSTDTVATNDPNWNINLTAVPINKYFIFYLNPKEFPVGFQNPVMGERNSNGSLAAAYNLNTVASGPDTFLVYSGRNLSIIPGAAVWSKLTFQLANCSRFDDTTVFVPVHYVWSCDSFNGLTMPEASLCDTPHTKLLPFTFLSTNIQSNKSQQNGPYSSCSRIKYAVSVTSRRAGGIGNFFTEIRVPKGAFIDTQQVLIGNTSLTIDSIRHSAIGSTQDTLWRIYFQRATAFSDSSAVGDNGLALGEQLIVNFWLRTGCNSDSIGQVTAALRGNLYCGATISQAVDSGWIDGVDIEHTFNPISITGDSCGPFVSAELANAPCSGPVLFNVGRGNFSPGLADTTWLPVIPNLNNPAPGIYYVTVTDSGGCLGSDTVSVHSQFITHIQLIGDPCDSLPDILAIDSIPAGSSYSFLWSNGSVGDTIHIAPLTSLTVWARVSDSLGCFTADTFHIAPIQPSYAYVQATCHSIHDGAINVTMLSDIYPYSFTWSNGDTLEDLSDAAVDYYDVTITDGNGCVRIDSNLFVHNLYSMAICDDSLDLFAYCPNQTAIYLQVFNSNVCGIAMDTIATYRWSDGSTSDHRDGLNAGTYSVTATDKHGCTSSRQYVIEGVTTAQGCCFQDPLDTAAIVLIMRDTLVSQIGNISGSRVFVGSEVTLYVDDTLIIQNEMVFGANGSIIIENGALLKVEGGYLHGCDTMWSGIYIPGTGKIQTQARMTQPAKIEDATYGIVLTGALARMDIRHTAFNRNRYGIRTRYGGGYDSLQYNISDCYFGMGPYTTMLPPIDDDGTSRPVAGIDVKLSKIDIPNPYIGGGPNIFEYMNNGIIADATDINIYNNYFRHIRNTDNGYRWGAAIYATSGSNFNDKTHMRVKTSSTIPADTSQAHFEHCDFGVFTNLSKVIVEQNRMDNVEHCVKTVNGVSKIWVSDNYLTHTNYGVTLNNNIRADNRVYNNYIFVNPSTLEYVGFDTASGMWGLIYLNTYGIYQAETNNQVPTTSSIYENHVWNGRNNIWLNNANGVQVFANELYHTASIDVIGKQAGIYASNCEDIVVDGNAVLGNGTTYYDNLNIGSVYTAYRKSGYSFYRSTGEFCSNTADSIGYATYFASDCHGLNVRSNIFGKSKFGVVLQSSGNSTVLSDQGFDNFTTAQRHQNEFIGSGSSHTFANDSNFRTYSFLSIPQDTLYTPPAFFYTGSSVDTNLQYTEPNSATINGAVDRTMSIRALAIIAGTVNNYSCATIANPVIEPWDLLVAGGNGESYMEAGLGEVGIWLAQRRLYNKLAFDTTLLSVDTVLRNFYNSTSATTIGQINRFERQLIKLNDSTILADSILYRSTRLEANELHEMISPGNTPETNYRMVNALHLVELSGTEELNPSVRRNLLVELAIQCPYIAGDAVYIARTLLAQTDDSLFYDDVKLCEQSLSAKKEFAAESFKTPAVKGDSLIQTLPEFVKVFPNPANNQLSVLFNAKLNGVTRLELINLMGQVAKTINIPDRTNYINFDITTVPSGLYMWRLQDATRTIGNGTVVIQK